MNRDKIERLNNLKVDDFIWYIYIFIVFAALFSNMLEKEFVVTNNKNKAIEFHSLNIIILTIAFFIYVYYVLKSGDSYIKNKNLVNTLSLIASILFLVGGGILLWLELLNSRDEIIETGI